MSCYYYCYDYYHHYLHEAACELLLLLPLTCTRQPVSCYYYYCYY